MTGDRKHKISMAKPKTRGGFLHILDAFKYSFQGLQSVWKTEEAFKLEVWLFSPLIVLAFFVGNSPSHIGLLIATVLLVWMMEFVNSAIEATVDRIGDEIHPLSRNAKDYGSASITVVLLIGCVIWVGALYEKLSPLLF